MLLLTIRAVSIQAGYTSPTPKPAPDEQKKFVQEHQNKMGDSGPFTILHAAKVTKVRAHARSPTESSTYLQSILQILVQALNIMELVSVLAASSPLPEAISRHALPLTHAQPSPALVLGSLLMAAGATLRVVAYRAMGSNFTFQLAIKKDHRLITHGPYAVVRHPSYTAVCIIILGIALSFLGPGSVYADLRLWDNAPTAAAGVVLFMMGVYIFFGMIGRMPKEDLALREEFKKEWVDWSTRVPCRLVPCIY